MNVAIVIAIEGYSDADIADVRFAQNDAEQFASALRELDFDAADQTVLINSQATKTTIESKVRQVTADLKNDDTLFFFYAGHGFSKDKANYITCFDTQPLDLAPTSIELQWVLEQIRSSRCKQSAIFLDVCGRGVLPEPDASGVDNGLVAGDLDDFFVANEHCVGFAACQPGEESRPSGQVKHSAWTFNIIEAFRGNAKSALEAETMLTANSLQKFLSTSVQQTLKEAYADQKDQTPWMIGSSAKEFLLADLTDLFNRRSDGLSTNDRQVMNASLLRRRAGQIRNLSGFKKSHKVPDDVTDRAIAFVASISGAEVQEDLEEKFASLKKAFKFKRKELSIANEDDGTGTIVTPYFNYSISISLDPEDSSGVVWEWAVDAIKEPDKIFSDEFSDVFGREFDTVEFSMPIDVEEFIDQVEELDADDIEIAYDMDATSCSLTVEGVDGKIEVTSETLAMVNSSPTTPRLMLESFFQIQRKLFDKHGVRAIAFEAGATSS